MDDYRANETSVPPRDLPVPRYDMGFCVNKIPIPDPASFTGAESDLDTMGKRDATGYLHRNKVATKHPLKVEYSNIPWEWIMDIAKLLKEPKFEFTYPSPFTGGMETMEAYVGDRNFESIWNPTNGTWFGSLKFSIIEY